MLPLHWGWPMRGQLRLWTDITVAPVIGPSHWLVPEWLSLRGTKKKKSTGQRHLLGRCRCYNESKTRQYDECQKCSLVFLPRVQMSLRVDRTRTGRLRNQATHPWDRFSTGIDSSQLKKSKTWQSTFILFLEEESGFSRVNDDPWKWWALLRPSLDKTDQSLIRLIRVPWPSKGEESLTLAFCF